MCSVSIARLTKYYATEDIMEKTNSLLIPLLAVLAVLLAGCVGGGGGDAGGVSPEEVRDGFVGNGSNVPSYGYEGETTFEIGAVGRERTQTTTTTTDAVLDYEGRRLRAEQVSGQGGQETRTTRYVVNGTAYDRTNTSSNDTGWIAFENATEANKTIEDLDELGLYARILENASVSLADGGGEDADGTDTHVLTVELDESERIDFLTGKLSEDSGFLNELQMEEFNTTVWISEDENRLVRARTEVSAVAPDQRTRAGVLDMRAEMTFVNEFRYDEPVEIELPDEARDAGT